MYVDVYYYYRNYPAVDIFLTIPSKQGSRRRPMSTRPNNEIISINILYFI